MNSMKLVIPLHSLYWLIHTAEPSWLSCVNWLWRCGVTALFGIFFHEIKRNGMTSFMDLMNSQQCQFRNGTYFLQNRGTRPKMERTCTSKSQPATRNNRNPTINAPNSKSVLPSVAPTRSSIIKNIHFFSYLNFVSPYLNKICLIQCTVVLRFLFPLILSQKEKAYQALFFF